MKFLGVDLGSSFIKGAVLDIDALTVEHVERLPFPACLTASDPARREFDANQVVSVTRTLLERLAGFAPQAAGVLMCGQMHGLVLTAADGAPASNVISWQDQRALLPIEGTSTTHFDEINRRITPDERRDLGNEARPGVPLCFLFCLAEQQALPEQPVVAASLLNFVVARLCDSAPTSDLTSAHAHGALNVPTGDWHHGVIGKLGLERVHWPAIVPQGTVLGEARICGRSLPVFAPAGDFQVSQAGALLADDELAVNVSTGSGVVRISSAMEFGDFQTRPFFDGRFLRTITHIPGGRALAALIRLLGELAEAQDVKLNDPWDYILEQAAAVETTDLRVDPAFYFSATGDHGSITGAREETLTVGHLFRATFEGMADNYARCAQRICPARDWTRLVFSGGVALKVALLRQCVCQRLGLEHRLAPSEEDTLLGLLVLALAYSGRSASVADATAFVRKNYEPHHAR